MERCNEMKLVGSYQEDENGVVKDIFDLVGEQNGVITICLNKEGNPKFAFMNCPCGCGAPCSVPAKGYRDSGPAWEIKVQEGRVTFTPSIRYLAGCKSHFNITDGKVVWHADSGK